MSKSKSAPQAIDDASAAIGGRPRSRVTVITDERLEKLRKTDASVIGSNALEMEDEFEFMYYEVGAPAGDSGKAIRPPFDPKHLAHLVTHNNTLLQCIEAMEVNIDGTGAEIVKDSEEEPTEAEMEEKTNIEAFFDEVYPGQSFTNVRRALRRDQESIGYGYLEVIRNPQNEMIFLKRAPAKTIRKMRLGPAVPTMKTVVRGGEEISVTVHTRPRRYIQLVGKRAVYFKEYGAPGHINRETGEWGDDIDASKRGNELIEFSVIEDALTPYGIPRWINQIPSVLGSRKAEEFNLDFFNAGGIPPVLILLMGGMLTTKSREELTKMMSGTKGAHRGAVVEVQSDDGSLEGGSKVTAQVERFSSEAQKDYMFKGYDEKAEEHVRTSFRLPPIFLGKSTEYNFNTARVAYLVAEAQIFKPERSEFDEIINRTIMKEIAPGWRYKSNGLTLSDIDKSIEALGMMAMNRAVSAEELVAHLNQLTNMEVRVAEPEDALAGPSQGSEAIEMLEKSGNRAGPEELIELAAEWHTMIEQPDRYTDGEQDTLRRRIASLSKADKSALDRMLSLRLMRGVDNDPDGIAALCGCAADLLHDHRRSRG